MLTNGATTTLILLRHGETEWNSSGRWQGQNVDTTLTDRGRMQAQVVAQRLSSYPVAAIYSSDLLRAFETAQIVGATLELAPVREPGLRESDIGRWTGLTWAEIAENYPDEVAAMFAGEDVRRGGGETYAELHARLTATVDGIVARHAGEVVLLVSHGAALRSLVAIVLGADLAQLHRIAIGGNTAISVVRVEHGVLRLVTYNDTAHLDQRVFQVSNAEGAGARPPDAEGKSE